MSDQTEESCLPSSENPAIEARPTRDRGIGVFAKQPIAAGTLIATFDGEVYSGTVAEDFPDHVQDYAIQFEETRVRDSEGIARYLNHSCDPNCGIVDRFSIVAMRDIGEGEELTWDYDMSENSDWNMQCRCGSHRCRGQIMGFRFLPPETRNRYEGFISDYLIEGDIPVLPLPSSEDVD